MADSAVPDAAAPAVPAAIATTVRGDTTPTVLADTPWPAIPAGVTLLVPLGSVEQHGPHLPLDVDTVVAVAVCEAASRGASGVRVAPPVAYGASGEHEDFPGTVSVGTAVLTETLIEIGRSARRWAARIVFVNGHGGNADAVTAAVARLAAEGADVSWLPCRSGDGHAGRAETSLLLHLAPERVRLDLAEAGALAPVRELLPRLRADGVRAVTPNGVLGDPRGASAAEGAAILQRMADEVRAGAGLLP